MKKTSQIAFLDTIPFLFLFCKYLPVGKTVGEIFQDSGYGFFVSGTCWKKNHFERWKNLEDIYSDFKHIDHLHYFVRQHLRTRLETQLTDKLDDYLEGNLRKNLMEIIEKIRSSSAFEEARPDYEETEVVLLATLVEKCKSMSYECRTIALLGDGIHSEILARMFDKNIRISTGVNFQYPKEKCFTLIDFLGSQSARDILPDEYIDALLTNYTRLKVFGADVSFLDKFLQELPAMQPSINAFGLKHFIDDLKSFCSDIKNTALESLIEATKAHYRSIVKRDPRILERAEKTISARLEKECSRLIRDFSQKYVRFMPRRTVRRSKAALDDLILQIREKAESLSKNVSVKSSNPTWNWCISKREQC